MSAGRIPTTANSPLTAKGDLFGYSTQPARLAVGSDGDTIVADSSTATGLRYIPYMSNNYAINGNFDIWQRGISFPTQGVYTADRWFNTQSANITGSQQTSGAPDGSRYYFRQTATNTGGYYTMSQVVETANASQLWGKTVTFSVKLKRNATYNAQVQIAIRKNAAVDASPSTTWTEIATKTVLSTDISTSDWTTFLVTATIPNDGTANSVMISQYYLTNPANGSTLDLAQFQFEIGSAVTSFRRSGGTIQGELAACQRYYWRQTATNANERAGYGSFPSSTQFQAQFNFPVTMRSTTSAVEIVGVSLNDTAAVIAVTGGSINVNSPFQGNVALTVASGGTQFRYAAVTLNTAGSSYIGFSAEL